MIQAIIWDFDGTLADTKLKNLEVTKAIMQVVIGNSIEEYAVLKSLDHYQEAIETSKNWRDLYRNYFRLTDPQIVQAGAMWKEYQMNDQTEVYCFTEIPSILNKLSHYRHGIVSQNARDNIFAILQKQKLHTHFRQIIGYEETGDAQQKPEPTGLLTCLENLTNFEPGEVVYIGDHETDVHCAFLANQKLKRERTGIIIYSIAALYGSSADVRKWEFKPDFYAQAPSDILSFISEIDA